MKKRVLKLMSVILVAAFLLTGFVGCGTKPEEEPKTSADSTEKTEAQASKLDEIKQKGVIVMGTNAEFPPFEFRNDKGEVDGFDVAIANEIAKELGVELKIEDMAFDSLINALKSGKINFIAAGMSVTEDRKQNVDFSEEYYSASQKIIVRKDNNDIKGKADLVGKKIGVQEGTTGDTEASAIEKVEMSRFKKAVDAVMDLKNGKIDAVVLDASPAQVFVNKNDDLKILDEELTNEAYAIAIDKGNEELVEVINKVINNLKESGKYDELVKQYIEEYTGE